MPHIPPPFPTTVIHPTDGRDSLVRAIPRLLRLRIQLTGHFLWGLHLSSVIFLVLSGFAWPKSFRKQLKQLRSKEKLKTLLKLTKKNAPFALSILYAFARSDLLSLVGAVGALSGLLQERRQAPGGRGLRTNGSADEKERESSRSRS